MVLEMQALCYFHACVFTLPKLLLRAVCFFHFSTLGDGRALGSGRSGFESQLKHLPNELLRCRDFHSQTFGEDFKMRTQGLVHRKPSASDTSFFPFKHLKC